MRTTTITALLLILCAASALAHSISVPMAHVQRRDPWWQQTKTRDVIAGLDNLRPPDVWTVNVTVGSPPQVFPVNIDTGSSDLLISTPVCAECNTLPELRFQAADSATFATLACDDSRCDAQCVSCRRDSDQCRFNNTYGDGTWAFGNVAADVISLNNLTATTPITFGVMTQTVPEFYINASVSGIFGLAFASSSCWGQNSALLNLFDQNPTVPRTFSLCLLPDGGEMTVGERFPSIAGAQDTTEPAAVSQPESTVPYVWTRYTTEGVFAGYGVNLRDVQVGGQSLGVSFRRLAIVDSGTTVVTIPTAAYNALTNKLLDSCSGTACDLFVPSNYFLPATLADIQELPDITFVFNGVTLTLTPLQYLSAGSSARDLWFFLIFPTDGTPIIGNQVMKYFRTAFDLENERIGFASAATACEGGDVWGPGAVVAATVAAQDNSGIDFSAAASFRVFSVSSIAALALLVMLITA